MAHVICFDLEGPLSPQDNAYEVFGLVENGDRIFEVISKYDDVLTLEGRAGYEPGDTLKLIAPFLIYHGITEEDIRRVSSRAKITPGAPETISELKAQGWKVYIISTSYQQHAYNIGLQLGIEEACIACTRFPLDEYRAEMKNEDFSLIENIEGKILDYLYPAMDEKDIVEVLDPFFFRDLLKTKLGRIFKDVRVVGGKRKVDAVERFAGFNSKGLDDVIVVGDSITDYKMLEVVRDAGGIAVVFNGNEYSVPYANVGLATLDQRYLLMITSNYIEGGKGGVMKVIGELEGDRELIKSHEKVSVKMPKNATLPYFHNLEDAGEDKIREVVDIHKKMRVLIRGEAGKLG